MAQVICKRPNASDEISGVRFTKHEDGMLSEDISDEQAAAFIEIPGYRLADDGKAARAAAAKADEAEAKRVADADAAALAAAADADAAAAAQAAEKASADAAAKLAADEAAAEKNDDADDRKELVARAEALGIEVKSTWKTARLTAEIARAESK